MKKTVDIGVLVRKLIEMNGLSEEFYHFSKNYILEGTGTIVYCDVLPEGVTMGMQDNTIIVGTKKERTAATGVL